MFHAGRRFGLDLTLDLILSDYLTTNKVFENHKTVLKIRSAAIMFLVMFLVTTRTEVTSDLKVRRFVPTAICNTHSSVGRMSVAD